MFVSLDERAADLDINSRSLGFDLAGLQANNLLSIDYIHLDRQEIHETGEYNLEGLFIRLGFAIDQVKARRIVLDGIDTLFAGLPNEGLLRSELRRLFGWLKERGLSSIITAERGEKSLTRHGIEEYVSDCVIVLEQRVLEELTTRRLRVVKYRGSTHGTNEYHRGRRYKAPADYLAWARPHGFITADLGRDRGAGCDAGGQRIL